MSDRQGDEQAWSDLASAWRSDGAGGERLAAVDMAAVRARAEKFAGTIRWRNVRELVACVVVAGIGVRDAIVGPDLLQRLAGGAFIAAAAWIAGVLLLRGGNLERPPTTATTREVLAFERAELERQARLLERAWLWYVLPCLPGVGLHVAHGALEALAGRRSPLAVSAAIAIAAVVLAAVAWLNAYAARKLREKAARVGGDLTSSD